VPQHWAESVRLARKIAASPRASIGPLILLKYDTDLAKSASGPSADIMARYEMNAPHDSHRPPATGLKNAVREPGRVDAGPVSIATQKENGSVPRATNPALPASLRCSKPIKRLIRSRAHLKIRLVGLAKYPDLSLHLGSRKEALAANYHKTGKLELPTPTDSTPDSTGI